MKFRKKPVVIEATQWFKDGDHDKVTPFRGVRSKSTGRCRACDLLYMEHGDVVTLEGKHIVCPGDWIITGVEGEHYPCKNNIFDKTYEAEDTEQIPIVEGINILAKYANSTFFICAEHDQIFFDVDEEKVTDEDKKRLDDLGFSNDENDGYYCFV